MGRDLELKDSIADRRADKKYIVFSDELISFFTTVSDFGEQPIKINVTNVNSNNTSYILHDLQYQLDIAFLRSLWMSLSRAR